MEDWRVEYKDLAQEYDGFCDLVVEILDGCVGDEKDKSEGIKSLIKEKKEVLKEIIDNI